MANERWRSTLGYLGCCVGLFLAYIPMGFAKERLVVVGGGNRPDKSTARFVSWAGGKSAQIMVITWASGDPATYYQTLHDELALYSPALIQQGPNRGQIATLNRTDFQKKIQSTTGFYFTGGNQNLIMDELEADEKLHPGPKSVLHWLRTRYQNGAVFGGTSAGCSVMTTPMFTGAGDLRILDGSQVGIRNALDILPGVILDQHFIAHRRFNRLLGLVQKNPKYLGLGVDESTALLVEDGRYAEVVGDSQVMAISAGSTPGAFEVNVLESGARFDLLTRARY